MGVLIRRLIESAGEDPDAMFRKAAEADAKDLDHPDVLAITEIAFTDRISKLPLRPKNSRTLSKSLISPKGITHTSLRF